MTLKRTTPINRNGYIVKRRPRRLDRETREETKYRAWVHTQPCVGKQWPMHECRDRFGSPTFQVEQSHIRFNTGMSSKPNEMRSLPMCGALHVQWEERKGVFNVAMLPNLERFAWAEPQIQEHNDRFRKWAAKQAVPK